ncbi:MAG: hypothetical protein OXG35_23435 [Acidobacteria bacterium]|nr:hypothetical protein [Acidobacteriota bacterium]
MLVSVVAGAGLVEEGAHLVVEVALEFEDEASGATLGADRQPSSSPAKGRMQVEVLPERMAPQMR